MSDYAVVTTKDQVKAADLIGRRIFAIKDEVTHAGVYHPLEDPGQWAPKSLLIVNTEMGFYLDPWSQRYDLPLHTWWERWENELEPVFGFPVFFESINAAVAALYPV